jgi:hypothetical protein
VLVLYASRTLAWVDLRMNAWFTGLTGITGWAASRLGASSTTSSGRRDTTGRIGPLASNRFIKEYGARSLMLVFLVLLAMLLAGVNEQVIRVLGDLPYRAAAFLPPYFEPFSCAAIPVIVLMAAYLALCLGASGFINVNKFSLHGMYRLRLIRAYLGASNTARNPHQFTGFDENDNIPMCALTASKPLHVLNMTVNLVAGRNLAWQQRKAEPFTSTRLHTGSCRVGYRSSALYGGRQNDRNPITLGTAITISGAAASPNMGYHSSPLLTLVMTLFNARLGWWLGNPRKPEKIWRRPGPRWGILPFMEEAFGLTTDENSWLYLSDGGHFENLGIYEMVLRRCSLIVVSDAGADPGYVYEDLANAVRKIRIDLGIPIEFDNPSMPMSPGRKPSKERTGHHCAIGRIHYGAVDPGAAPGTIVYIKASLNGNEPPDVQQYAATDATFPHQSTTDQFFDEAQFESYRRLGLHVIEEICGNPRAGLDLDEFVTLAEQYAAAPLTARARVPATLAS